MVEVMEEYSIWVVAGEGGWMLRAGVVIILSIALCIYIVLMT